MSKLAKIISANRIDTGGHVDCYYGEMENGLYFLASDGDSDNIVLIVDENPKNDLDKAFTLEWQEEHTVETLKSNSANTIIAEIRSKIG